MQTIKLKDLQYTYYYWIHGIVDCQRVKEPMTGAENSFNIFRLFDFEAYIITLALIPFEEKGD